MEAGKTSRRPWARPLLRLMPMRIWLALEHELRLIRIRLANAVLPWRRRRLRAYHRRQGLKLNLGCGAHRLDGWVNVDGAARHPVDLRIDLRRPLPFGDGSSELVFSHHVLEHLEYPDEALAFLRECRRVMAPQGVLRVVVPDLERYARNYLTEEGRVQLGGLIGETEPLNEPAEWLHEGLWRYHAHLFAYDESTLAGLLRLAGFTNVERVEFGESSVPELARDRDEYWYPAESLYMEARP
jgi:predicted SAM-dependent methyltransferase